MSIGLIESLSELDGEELAELLSKLARGRIRCATEIDSELATNAEQDAAVALARELDLVWGEAVAQVARITVPFRQAQGIVWRAQYARGHPVKVPGT